MELEFIREYENLYKINRNGVIYSCCYSKNMKHLINDNGYKYVSLTKSVDGQRKRSKCFIHRLLAIQYIPNPDNKPEVDHIDRNIENNSLENLRWVTRDENMKNRTYMIANLTEDELKERAEKIKIYKKEWAEKNRRKNGILERVELTEEQKKIRMEEQKEKKKKYAKEKLLLMTPEEKEKYLKYCREIRKPTTEEQKEKAKIRAKKQREKLKASSVESIQQLREYKKLKAREYRLKKATK